MMIDKGKIKRPAGLFVRRLFFLRNEVRDGKIGLTRVREWRRQIMWIQEAEIRNFKGITDWKLSFKQGFNLIKGENGKGKTSILEALAVGLGGYLLGIDGVNTRHFTKEEIRKSYSRTGEGTYGAEHHLPTQVSLTVDLGDSRGSCTWTRGRSSNGGKFLLLPDRR